MEELLELRLFRSTCKDKWESAAGRKNTCKSPTAGTSFVCSRNWKKVTGLGLDCKVERDG